MQRARIVRLVDEAATQDAILSLGDISLLTITTAKTIREALKPLWLQGIRLPVMGMAQNFSRGMRQSLQQRAFSRFLNNEQEAEVRQDLHLSESTWQNLLGEAARQIGRQSGELYEVWQEAGARDSAWPLAERRPLPSRLLVEDREQLDQSLTSYFGMTPAGADLLVHKVRHWLSVRSDACRKPLQVVYYAVADDEPPGKSLQDCELVPVVLDYVTAEDQAGFDRNAPRHLFTDRLERFTRQAYQQGGVLNQSDLAFLLGGSSDGVGAAIKETSTLLPTRGNVMDIGPGMTHAQKIVQLHMEGYSETQIAQRTQHSYASIENYIDKFCKIVGLSDDGLTPVEIRILLGCSLNAVKDYLALKKQFDTRDYRWTMAQVRERYAQMKSHGRETRQE